MMSPEELRTRCAATLDVVIVVAALLARDDDVAVYVEDARRSGDAGLLTNPHGGLPPEQRERWIRFVDGRRLYGRLKHGAAEPEAVDKAGLLQIDWPKLTDGPPLMLDALLATATDPTLIGGTRYPTASEVAEAWDTLEGREHLRYFCGNRQNGIETFQDGDIEGHLRRLGHVC